MFAPYCPGHRTRVLLSVDAIDEMVRLPEGFDIRFHCNAGHEGRVRLTTRGLETTGREA